MDAYFLNFGAVYTDRVFIGFEGDKHTAFFSKYGTFNGGDFSSNDFSPSNWNATGNIDDEMFGSVTTAGGVTITIERGDAGDTTGWGC
jgi:hypothetical protein